jgi:hypothetical protein
MLERKINQNKQKKTLPLQRIIASFLLLPLLSISAYIYSQYAHAAITKEISYQGKLTNTSGVAVTDGNYNMVLSLYTVSTGGTPVWTARGTVGTPTTRSVAVANGIFSIMLGDTAAGDNAINLDFNSTYYLGIKVGSDTEMAPRKKVGASGYAFNSDLLDGLDSATSGVNAHIVATDASGNITATGDANVNGGDINSTTTLTLNPTGNLNFQSSSYYVNESGQMVLNTDETVNGIDINAGAISDVTTISSTYLNTAASYVDIIGSAELRMGGTSVLTSARALQNITAATIDNIYLNGTTIGHTSDTDLLNLASGILTVNGTLDLNGPIDLDVSVNDYAANFYNSNTGAAAGGLYIRTDGTGNLLTLNASGTDIVTISPTQASFNVPTSFTSSGDVSMAYDLIFTNQTAANIKTNAPFTIEVGELFESNDLTLRTFNNGDVVLDAAGGVTLMQAQPWVLATATSALNFQNSSGTSILNIDSTNGRVGIGTTGPLYTLHVNGGDIYTSGDMRIAGDDLFMATNTSGMLLIADGTNYNPVAMSGDVTITSAGVTTIADNSVDGTDIALGADTTGDLMYYNGTDWARLADIVTGNALISGGVGVAPSWGKIVLGTHTTGSYVATEADTLATVTARGTVTNGQSITIGPSASYDPINISAVAMGSASYVGIITSTDLTASRTWTFPNVAGTVITTGDTGTVTNTMLAGSIANTKLANSTISGIALGSNLSTLTIGTGLSGTSYNGSTGVTIAVNTSQNISTLSNLTTNGFVKTSGGTGALTIDTNTYLTGNQSISLTGDVTGTGTTSIATTIAANSVALTTDTTGNYVANVATGSGLTGGSAGSEGAALTLSLSALTANWSQTGAFDIQLANASSELQIMESTGATYYGTLDVGDLSANGTYTFSGASGTVWTSGNDGASSTLDADLWDGNQFASYLNQAVLTTSSPTFAGLTLTSDLTVANGGTGASTFSANYLLKGNGASAISSSQIYDNGTNVGIGTSSPSTKLTVAASLGAGYTSMQTFDETSNTGATSMGIDWRFAGASSYPWGSTGRIEVARQTTTSSFDMAFHTANSGTLSEKMRILANGNVGIGTTSPGALLHLAKSGAAAELWLQRTDGYTAVKLFGSTLADGNGFKINVGGSDRFAIDSSGNVGIGTTTPGQKLEIYGNAVTPAIRLSYNSAGVGKFADIAAVAGYSAQYNGLGMFVNSDSNGAQQNTAVSSWATDLGGGFDGTGSVLGKVADAFTIKRLAAGGTTWSNFVTVLNNGNVGIGTTSPGAKLDVEGAVLAQTDLMAGMQTGASNPRILIGDNGTAGNYGGMIWDSTNKLLEIYHQSGGVSQLVMNSVGNVGIGTTTVSYKLHVNGGDIYTSGDMRIAGDDLFMATNTSGMLLIADGTNYNPTAMSGDVLITGAGATTIQANSVALTTDTTGNYVAGLTAGTAITIGGTAGEGWSPTVGVTADSIGDTQLAFNTGQNLTTTSSPTFAGLTLNGNLVLGANTLTTTNTNVVTNLNADLLDGTHLNGIMPYQSGSDFADGTLVATDIPANVSDGDSFVIEISGKSYNSSNAPFKVIAQGYLYGGAITSYSGISYGGTFSSYIKMFEDGGVLKFWWPRISYWNSFDVHVRRANGSNNSNSVTSITNSTEPTGTKKVQANLQYAWNNINDGAGTGLDADLLDGAQPSMVAGNSTIVQRNASGYVLANYFNTTANVTTSTASHFAIQTGSDNYIRWQTPADARTSLGLVAAGGGDIWVEKAGDTMSGQLTSTLATGTSPFAVTSTTVNSNLNADLLDGLHSSSFASSSLTSVNIADTRDSGDVTPNDFNDRNVSFSFTDEIVGSTNAWDSVLTMKGWADDYRAWQLLSNSDTSDSNDNLYFRSGRSTTWGTLRRVWDSGNDGTGSTLDADLWDGYQFASYLNQPVLSTSSPAFAGMTLTGALTTSSTIDGYDIGTLGAYFISSAGTSGQVWTSDGSGAGYWAAGGGTGMPSGTEGQMLYNNAGTWTAFSTMFWDDTNSRLGIGTTAPGATLNIFGTTNSFRLSYDASNYSTLSTGSTGILTMASSNGTQSAITLGAGTAIDQLILFDGNTRDFYVGQDDTDDFFKIGSGAAVGSNTYLTINGSGNVGIGVTNPATYKFYVDWNSDGASPAYVNNSNAWTNGSADYAEFFKTNDPDLSPGEAVCVDINNSNAVKRCQRAEDPDLMGIVSTSPSVLGNAEPGREFDKNYVIVGMLGQVPAKVSTENGQINPGDSLTAATKPGTLMKANAGDSTVGVALEPIQQGEGSIQVLISRRNKSLTVEKVEEEVSQRIAEMDVEDQVNQMITQAQTQLNESINSQTTVISDLTSQLTQTSNKITTLQEQMDLIKQQNQTILDFALALDIEKLIYKDESGNLDLKTGKLITAEVVAGAFTVKVTDENNKTIGESKIKAITKDEDNDGKDDETGSDGKSVVVKTGAVGEGSKIFVTTNIATEFPLAVTKKIEGEGFMVEMKNTVSEDITFDWWIVESEK